MPQPNILLVVLDDVRKDHLSYYGHRNKTTPNLDQLAGDSTVFENAFANSNWTPVSHGAIFTGQLPSHTGIYGNTLGIPEGYETLPELLKKQGYQTFSTSAGAHLRAERGYARGFDDYQVTHNLPTLPDISAPMLSLLFSDSAYRKQFTQHLLRGWDKATVYKFESLKRWIRSVDNGPYFGFINLKTARSPYRPPRHIKTSLLKGIHKDSTPF